MQQAEIVLERRGGSRLVAAFEKIDGVGIKGALVWRQRYSARNVLFPLQILGDFRESLSLMNALAGGNRLKAMDVADDTYRLSGERNERRHIRAV